MLKNYTAFFNEIGGQIELITGDDIIKFSKDIIRIKFKTNDDLPLNKIVNIPVCVIIVSSVFRKDNEYYP